MGRALSKVHKQLAKKRGKKEVGALHENSRDAKRLRRASAREERLERTATTAAKARQTYLDRVKYFQQLVAAEQITAPVSGEQMAQLIAQYLARDADDLAQLRSARRKGRPPSKREELLAQREESENKEFDAAGFWAPDMGDAANLGRLKGWNGEWSALSAVAFWRVGRDADTKESSFPPSGRS